MSLDTQNWKGYFATMPNFYYTASDERAFRLCEVGSMANVEHLQKLSEHAEQCGQILGQPRKKPCISW